MIVNVNKNIRMASAVAAAGLAALTVAAPSWAQGATAAPTAAPTPGQGQKTAATPSNKLINYKVSRDDILTVTVVNRPEVSQIIQVEPDGFVEYPYVGRFKAVGMTTSAVREHIRKGLAKYYVRPQVIVALRERALKTVSLLGTGLGNNRGKQPLKDGFRIMDVLAGAGGLPDDRFEFYKAQLIRPGTDERIDLDLVKVYDNDPDANVELQADDIVIVDRVEEAKTLVYVSGPVTKPGPVILPRDRSLDTLWQFVAPALPIAKLSKAHVERDGEIIPVDLRPLVDKGTLAENIQLQPGDKLVVPENKDYVYLMGPVAKPGISLYPDDRKLTVSKFLVEAGMSPQQAEDKQTMVIRSMPDGTTQKFVINVEDMLKTGDFSKDMELQPGDYVFVPYKKGSGTQRALNTLSQVGFAVGGVIGLQQVLRLLGF